MIAYTINKGKQNITEFKIGEHKKDPFKNNIFIAKESELPSVLEALKISPSSLSNLNKQTKYFSLGSMDMITLFFIPEKKTEIKIDIIVSDDFLIFSFPENQGEQYVKKFHALINNRIGALNAATTEKTNISFITKIFYDFFAFYATESWNIAEIMEDKIDDLETEILTDVQENQINKIDVMRKHVYFCKKHYNALSKIIKNEFTNIDNNLSFLSKHKWLFKKIDSHIDALVSYCETLYSLCSKLSNTYDSKVNNRLNKSITRLTYITIIMGLWTIFVGLYGMNVKLPFEEKEWIFYLLVGVMLTITIVILFVLHRKKAI